MKMKNKILKKVSIIFLLVYFVNSLKVIDISPGNIFIFKNEESSKINSTINCKNFKRSLKVYQKKEYGIYFVKIPRELKINQTCELNILKGDNKNEQIHLEIQKNVKNSLKNFKKRADFTQVGDNEYEVTERPTDTHTDEENVNTAKGNKTRSLRREPSSTKSIANPPKDIDNDNESPDGDKPPINQNGNSNTNNDKNGFTNTNTNSNTSSNSNSNSNTSSNTNKKVGSSEENYSGNVDNQTSESKSENNRSVTGTNEQNQNEAESNNTNISYIFGLIIGALLFFTVGNILFNETNKETNLNIEDLLQISVKNKNHNSILIENNIDVMMKKNKINGNNEIYESECSPSSENEINSIEIKVDKSSSVFSVETEEHEPIQQIKKAYIVDRNSNISQMKNKKVYSINKYINNHSINREYNKKNKKFSRSSNVFHINSNVNTKMYTSYY